MGEPTPTTTATPIPSTAPTSRGPSASRASSSGSPSSASTPPGSTALDIGGTLSFKGLAKAIAVVADVASIVPGPIGMLSGGVAAGAYQATGDRQAALWAAAGAAAAMVGGGAAVKLAKVSVAAKTGALALRAGPKAARAASGGKTATDLGQAGELAVEELDGVGKNTKSSIGPVTGKVRIPDFIKGIHIHELKNVNRISLTQQLRDSEALVRERGGQLVLWVNQRTHVAKTILKHEDIRVNRLNM